MKISAVANINDISSNVLIKSEPLCTVKEVDNMVFQSPSSLSGVQSGNLNKRPASLDLKNTTKKRLVSTTLLIESPETQQKSLTTPDLDKILHFLPTPQPGTIYQTKNSSVTSEQEAFGKGFEEALNSLHTNSSKHQVSRNETIGSCVSISNVTTTNTIASGMSGGSFTYTELETFSSMPIKDEPQNPPSSPPVSPIDMETQEKIKLERKRQRNRVAASKCRKRKLERISKLEDKVKMLKGENTDLGSIIKNLKEHVAQLKQQVIEHIESGCSIQTMCNGNTILHNK
ncbi:transcription factor Jra [Stomoxys calcitrans]|uniref:BZIP domain-containing protein n=1 Tax=Stomoxys calcitrans TaxID=35570 RepID=A0A1I8PKU4_STOCA|nr:transcription factor Jra [Stomoxys calcitrans]